MRLYSTLESAENREVSLLAIVETVLACGLCLWLTLKVLESWVPLVVASCVAPFLLLRTRQSAGRGASELVPVFTRHEEWIRSGRTKSRTTCFACVSPIYMITASALIRLSATLRETLRHPIAATLSIPKNWHRATLCTDSATPLEYVPGITQLLGPSEDKLVNSAQLIATFKGTLSEARRSKTRTMDTLVSVLVFSILALPLLMPLLVRLSLKSTAIVWFPLLWIVPRQSTATTLTRRMRLIYRSSLGRMVLAASLLTLAALAMKPIAFNLLTSAETRWTQLKAQPVFESLIEPFTFPLWQLACGASSIIAIVMFFVAGHLLTRLEKPGQEEKARALGIIMSTGATIRAMLSLYTISSVLYILMSQIDKLMLPPIGDDVFPWL